MTSHPFPGFQPPKRNFFRLPNDFLDVLHDLYAYLPNSRLLGAVLKVLLFLFARTWNHRRSGQAIHVSIRAISAGQPFLPPKASFLSTTTVRKVLRLLIRLGLVERIPAKRSTLPPGYVIRLNSTEEQSNEPLYFTQGQFTGFPPPRSNYFAVPLIFISLIHSIRSGILIWILLYLLRHGYGYSNPKGIWLTMDDLRQGRGYKTRPDRYDKGIPADERSLYRALKEGLESGLLVYRKVRTPEGAIVTQYNLHLEGMRVAPDGAFLGWEDQNAESLPFETEASSGEVPTGEFNPTTDEFNPPADEVNPPTDEINPPTGEFNPTSGEFNPPKGRLNTFSETLRTNLSPNTSTTPPRSPLRKPPPGSGHAPASGTDAVVDLPVETLNRIRELGWLGGAEILARLHRRDPELLDMLLLVAESDERITNPPGWLRQMGHIALQPGTDHTRFKESLLRKYPTLLSDTDFNRRRYRDGPYAEFFE